MIKSRNRFIALALLGPIVYVACQQQVLSNPPLETPIQRLRREGIRAMSSGEPEKLAPAGFNMAIPWERPLSDAKKTTSPDSPTILRPEDFAAEAVEKLKHWASECKKNDILMMYMMYVAAEPSVRFLTGVEPEPDGHLLNYIGFGERDPLNPRVKKIWPAHQYRKVVDWHGEPARWAPCPLERRIWIGFIQPQLELVAGVLQETGADGGAALELETYCFYSIYPGMASQKKTFCYCDHCFYGFVRSLGDTDKLPAVLPRVRFDWLTQRGLLPRYEQYLETEMAKLIKEMMRAVRKIDPDFLFGFYPYAPFWYYDALIRGSGTAELPTLVFPSAEYYSGFSEMGDPGRTFFGDASTAAGVAHLRRRQLPALYAGGIWNFSEEAVALATDQLVRRADGYWMYTGRWSTERHESISKLHTAVVRWTKDHPGPLPAGDLNVDAMAAAKQWVKEHKPQGISVSDGAIAARYLGEASEVPLSAAGFESDDAVAGGWFGRGGLPPVDTSVVHSGAGSLCFEPSLESSSPVSPYIDQKVPGARKEQSYELTFWTKTAGGGEPIRFWVGAADSAQWPAYMLYHNYVLPADRDWARLRIPISYRGKPPLVLRFWCQPTGGKTWLDDVGLRPVEARTIDVLLTPPANATGWGNVDWMLSPPDARCEARIIDPEGGHDLRINLYAGDSLAPLAAIVGLKPVLLRLEVYPSAAEPVILKDVQIRFVSNSSGREQQ